MQALREFLKLESSSGILLIAAMVIALVFANTPLHGFYEHILDMPVAVHLGGLSLAKPFLLWVNDGLMAIFFLLVGLEVKREILEGDLSSKAQVLLPALAGVGGMLVPAALFVVCNMGVSENLRGWAIPTATDIAFALGVMSLLGRRVPAALKLFLLALAILDDLGAIVIIALFYTSNLAIHSLVLAGLAIVVLFAMNFLGVVRIAAYMVVGVLLWLFVLKSGVHATLAGVVIAFSIPLRTKEGNNSPLRSLEHNLHPWVAYGILPLFAFANAGVHLLGMSPAALFAPLPLGIVLGLFVGKPLGIVVFSWVGIKLNIARLPDEVNWKQFCAMGMLCGIGFTMSLFISTLALDSGSGDGARLGVLFGSVLSACVGYALLYWSTSSETVAVSAGGTCPPVHEGINE